jgi:hypothetical protein
MPEVKKSLQHVYYDSAASPFLYSDTIYSIAITILEKRKYFLVAIFPSLIIHDTTIAYNCLAKMHNGLLIKT